MSKSMFRCVAQLVALLATNCADAQTAFQLDPTFHNSQLAGGPILSVLPLADGKSVVAGYLGGNYINRLLPSGTADQAFVNSLGIGQKHIRTWQDKLYVASNLRVKRLHSDSGIDYSYGALIPYYFPDEANDYLLYPNGSIAMAGHCILLDTVHGFVGNYGLVWFTPDGHLDSTRTHRTSNGTIAAMEPLNNGGFLLSGPLLTQYDGHAVGHIFKVDSLGALDTTFNTTANYGWAANMLPLPDGRILAAGQLMFGTDPDTMGIVRLLPDGSLDTTFNNHLPVTTYSVSINLQPWVYQVYPLSADSLIIMGAFNNVDGVAHNSIALIDSTGHLRSEIFPTGSGATPSYVEPGLEGYPIQIIVGMVRDAYGGYLIYGDYHGYSDGVNNDPGQWDVTRLNGLNVGVQEQVDPKEESLQVYPDPSNDEITVQWDSDLHPSALEISDVTGRVVSRGALSATMLHTVVSVGSFARGTYCLKLVDGPRPVAARRFVIDH